MQIVIQGLLLSGLYALIAMGFTLIFSVGRVLNLAYGAILMLGGYVYFVISQTLGLPKFAGVLMAAMAGCVFGIAMYSFMVKPLKGNHVAVEIDSILVATIISWAILIGLYVFVRRTHTGRAMQAVSMDVKGAAISGVRPDRINVITWALSSGLAAVAGVFFASYTQLSPSMWVAPLIIAVAVVIVGGIGSIMGTLVVAHVIGFMEVITVSWIAPELRGVFTMLLIIVVLIFRPRGFFGRDELQGGP